MLKTDSAPILDSHPIEQRLAQALREADASPELIPEGPPIEDASSRELFQLAWDRAEQEIDDLRTELRLLRQRHQEAERSLVARINRRKRLREQILQSVGESAPSV